MIGSRFVDKNVSDAIDRFQYVVFFSLYNKFGLISLL